MILAGESDLDPFEVVVHPVPTADELSHTMDGSV